MFHHRAPLRFAHRVLILLTCALTLALTACGSSSGSSSAGAHSCAKASLSLRNPGVLTIATAKPALAPYFEHGDPVYREGFEGAIAYAIAKKLGFGTSEVKWTTEPRKEAYAPGPKAFDFDIDQLSITPAHAKQVDFSIPYYTAPGGDRWGVLLSKGSTLTRCVDDALIAVRSEGELRQIRARWLPAYKFISG